MSNISESLIPREVSRITDALESNGFEAYLIGGCVRDLLLGRQPKDWDVTTNAKPEEIIGIFEKTYYTNEFGTVGVVNETDDESTRVVEITPYRIEGAYSDARRPDSVIFSTNLEDDLKRRDFTINAIAYSPSQGHLVDLFEGRRDIENKIIRAVGNPSHRFAEDALRILRAVRIYSELGFSIDGETEEAIKKSSQKLAKISMERIRDEFIRIILTENPRAGLLKAQELGVLGHIVPDLQRGIGVEQNRAHKYDVFEHNLRTLQHAADKNFSSDIRIAALLHDISKPETRRWSEEKRDWTFYGHDVVGARLARKILNKLVFPQETIKKVVALVRWHMFFSDPEKITLSGVRRIIRNVGKENIWDLVDLRICDRIGTGRPKEQPFRLRKYKSMIEEALRDPLTVSMLALDGNDLMKLTGEKPGPKIGYTLHALLEEVLDDPSKNNRDYLEKEAKRLIKLPEKELQELGERGKKRREQEEAEEVKKLRHKYWVS